MTRSVPEWIGKTDDTPIPPSVKLRVFSRYDGICHISNRKIRPGDDWDCDHVIRIKDGGENRESNLKPALRKQHQIKTADENKQQAREDRLRKKHLGIESNKPKWKWPKRSFPSQNWNR